MGNPYLCASENLFVMLLIKQNSKLSGAVAEVS